MFTLLLKLNVISEQRWIQFELQNSPSRILNLMAKYTLPLRKPVKSDLNQKFWFFQNNLIKTTKIFSVWSSPAPPILKKLQSDPVLFRPKLASFLIQSRSVIISTRHKTELEKLSLLSVWSSGKLLDKLWVRITHLLYLIFILMYLHKIVCQNFWTPCDVHFEKQIRIYNSVFGLGFGLGLAFRAMVLW